MPARTAAPFPLVRQLMTSSGNLGVTGQIDHLGGGVGAAVVDDDQAGDPRLGGDLFADRRHGGADAQFFVEGGHHRDPVASRAGPFMVPRELLTRIGGSAAVLEKKCSGRTSAGPITGHGGDRHAPGPRRDRLRRPHFRSDQHDVRRRRVARAVGGRRGRSTSLANRGRTSSSTTCFRRSSSPRPKRRSSPAPASWCRTSLTWRSRANHRRSPAAAPRASSTPCAPRRSSASWRKSPV